MLSLWAVEDRSTADFMGIFYDSLTRQTKGAACAVPRANSSSALIISIPTWAPFVLPTPDHPVEGKEDHHATLDRTIVSMLVLAACALRLIVVPDCGADQDRFARLDPAGGRDAPASVWGECNADRSGCGRL